jgi:hypothetical protein
MAVDLKPSTWIASYSLESAGAVTLAAQSIVIPIASLGVSAANANATTGDIRAVLLSLLETINTKWNTFAVADQPAKMQVGKGREIRIDPTIADATYSVKFVETIAGTLQSE